MIKETSEKAIQYLMRSGLFRGVSEQVLRSLDPAPEVVFLRAGETLFRPGDDGSDYFLLISGRLQVFRETEENHLKSIGKVLPGEGVGEMDLLTNEPRSETVIARLDSELVRFPPSTFFVLAVNDPIAVLNIARQVIERVRKPERKRDNKFPAIAVLGLTPSVDVAGLARSLTQELARYGRAHPVDADFHGDLGELEERFDFVIYVGGSHADQWSRTCMMRADLVLLATDVSSPAEPGEIEREILATIDWRVIGRIDLLLLHPDNWREPNGAIRWLRRIRPAEHHHLRIGNAGDVARLGRIITGVSNNVVLSGGGARALAHIGVLRALKEFHIPVDRVAGTSMGAAIAAIASLDDGFEDAAKKMRNLFLERHPGRDYTLPLVSLLTGKRMLSIGVDIFHQRTVEDLPRRFFCVSSDLSTGELIEHFDGPLWIALRATTALPVVAPPFLRDGRVMVDGGVLNNLPIDIMHKHFTGRIIAVDVSKHRPLDVDERWNLACPSGFDILKAKLRPSRNSSPGFPGILEVLRRSATLASDRQAARARNQADLLIAPPVQQYGVTDFNRFDEIVECGYRSTVAMLEKGV